MVYNPVDLNKLSKFIKSVQKDFDSVTTEVFEPKFWISTGNYALNKAITGDYNKGIALGDITMFAGEPGAAKSLMVSGSLAKNAQEQGIMPLIIDTEHALKKTWLEKLGVDTSEEKLMYFGINSIDDCAKFYSDFMKWYKSEYDNLDYDDRPRFLIIIDSLGMLTTRTSTKQFEDGDVSKGDMGRKAKALRDFVVGSIGPLSRHPIAMVCTNHIYQSQDLFDPDDKVSGGLGVVYGASNVIMMKKGKLKEDEFGKSTGAQVTGIRSLIKIMKSRYAKPFEKLEIKIPYEGGLLPYSGLVEQLEAAGLLIKDGNKLKYTFKDGSEEKHFRNDWSTKETDVLDRIMSEIQSENIEVDTQGVLKNESDHQSEEVNETREDNNENV